MEDNNTNAPEEIVEDGVVENTPIEDPGVHVPDLNAEPAKPVEDPGVYVPDGSSKPVEDPGVYVPDGKDADLPPTQEPVIEFTQDTPVAKLIIHDDGEITFNDKTATNDQLESYFDYSTYSDSKEASMVEGIFKSNNVTINGVTYKAELNQNGEMISADGKTLLTKDQIKKYLGEKGYEALVCKATKDVEVKDKQVIIKDRKEKVKIDLSGQGYTQIDPEDGKEEDKDKDKEQEEEKPTTPPVGVAPGGGSHGGSSGGGGSYSGGSSSGGGSYSGGSSSDSSGTSSGSSSSKEPEQEQAKEDPNPYGFKAKQSGNDIIVVEFEQLGAIRDELQTQKANLSSVTESYQGTVNGLSGNNDAWDGVDKEAYISQKKGYATNIAEVSNTLTAFVDYLDTCLTNYEQLEKKLAAKEIS